MSEGDSFPEEYWQMVEVAGLPPEPVPMTPFQEFYLKNEIDPMVDRLIVEMDKTMKARKASDEYQRRTGKELREL